MFILSTRLILLKLRTCISALLDQGPCSNSAIPLILGQKNANEKLC